MSDLMVKSPAISVVFSVLGGILGLAGGYDGLLKALVIFAVIDYITGLICGVIEKKLSSETGFKGIFKKILIFMLVIVAHVIDTEFITTGAVARTAVIMFYLANEGISILENAVRLGLPVPKKLIDLFEGLKKKGDENK